LDYSGEDKFAASAFGIEIHFNRDESGEVKSLTLRQAGQNYHGKTGRR